MRKAFSLVECTVSVMLVGILMAAALRSVATSHLRNGNSLLRIQGKQLCESFHQEILSKAFAEPGDGTAPLGTDGSERQSLRTGLDDVDDYANLNITPPTDARGNMLAGFDAWRVTVAVGWADPATLATSPSSNTNFKRMEIQAYYANQLITSVIGYRAADEY